MRDLFVLMSLVCFGPIAMGLLWAFLSPKQSIEAFGPVWWIVIPTGLIGLVGIVSLTAFSWDGSRPLRVAYLRVTVIAFLVSVVALCLKARIFGHLGAGILLYYAGWWGALLIAALVLPLIGTLVLLWSARRYFFG